MPLFQFQNVKGTVKFEPRKKIYDENLWIRSVCKRAPNWIHTAGFYKGEFVKDPDNRHIAFISLVKGQSKPSNIRYHFYTNCTILDL